MRLWTSSAIFPPSVSGAGLALALPLAATPKLRSSPPPVSSDPEEATASAAPTVPALSPPTLRAAFAFLGLCCLPPSLSHTHWALLPVAPELGACSPLPPTPWCRAPGLHPTPTPSSSCFSLISAAAPLSPGGRGTGVGTPQSSCSSRTLSQLPCCEDVCQQRTLARGHRARQALGPCEPSASEGSGGVVHPGGLHVGGGLSTDRIT